MLNGQYLESGANNQSIHNILYYVDRLNPIGPYPFQPESDPQFKSWEWAVRSYYQLPQQYYPETRPAELLN